MGTRSLTRVVEDGKQILNLYRQFDGYPEGHGAELAEFLTGLKMVNGIGPEKGSRIANGYGCLAAQLVKHFKDGPGGFYLQATEDTDCGQDFEYIISGAFGDPPPAPRIEVYVAKADGKRGKCLFKGSVEGFTKFCAKQAEAA